MSWFMIFVIVLVFIAVLYILNYLFGDGKRPKYKGVDWKKVERVIDGDFNALNENKRERVDETIEEQKSISEQVSQFSEKSRDAFYHCKRPYFGKSSKGQRACREFLQDYFGLPFLSCRPNFLINPETDRLLEYDCYEGSVVVRKGESPIPLAVEYQGEAHYHHVPFFHKSYNDFIEQQRRDEFKSEMSAKLGVYLIRVPYSVSVEQIPRFIKDRLPDKLLKSE